MIQRKIMNFLKDLKNNIFNYEDIINSNDKN